MATNKIMEEDIANRAVRLALTAAAKKLLSDRWRKALLFVVEVVLSAGIFLAAGVPAGTPRWWLLAGAIALYGMFMLTKGGWR